MTIPETIDGLPVTEVGDDAFGHYIRLTSVTVGDNVTSIEAPVRIYTLAGGSSFLSDPEWTNHPSRFYRLRSP